jgi:hypothetical protein
MNAINIAFSMKQCRKISLGCQDKITLLILRVMESMALARKIRDNFRDCKKGGKKYPPD